MLVSGAVWTHHTSSLMCNLLVACLNEIWRAFTLDEFMKVNA